MQDFTRGNETKQIVAFTIPMFIGSFFQQFYNLIDSVIVGKYIGAHALAAVGTSTPIIFFVVVIMNGFAAGMAITITQLFGAKRIRELQNTVFSTFFALIVLCIVLSAVGAATAQTVLKHLLGVPESIMADAVTFLEIYFAGLVFVFLYNAISFLLRSVGDSRTPVIFLIVSSLINVVLALLFVKQLEWGIAGAAWATFLAQAAASVMMIAYTYLKVPVYHIKWREVQFDRKLLALTLRQGVPNALQQAFLGVGGLALQGLVNSFGEVTIAAVSAAFRVEQVFSQIALNFSRAISIFTGQNIGAGNFDRVDKGLRRILLLGIGFGIVCSAIVIGFGESIIGAFLSSDTTNAATAEQVMQQGKQYLSVTGFFFAFVFATNIIMGTLRGSGDVMFTTVGTLAIFLLRIATAYGMSVIPQIGYQCIWWSQPFMWVPGAVGLWLRYKKGTWKTKSVVRNLERASCRNQA